MFMVSLLKLMIIPLFRFKFQYPSEWKRVMSEGPAGMSFSLYELNSDETHVCDTYGFMVLPTTDKHREYLRNFNPILNIDTSTLKMVDTKIKWLSCYECHMD